MSYNGLSFTLRKIMSSPQTPAISVRITVTLPANTHQDFQQLTTDLGIEFNTGVKMALLHSISIHQQKQSPFGYLPVASYKNCRDNITQCLKLGMGQDAFDIFYANPQTSKKVTIQNHSNFLDDGIIAGWAYRDGSTNEKLCLRLTWALLKIKQQPKLASVNWTKLARESAVIYP